MVMGENITEAGSNKAICRGSTAYLILSLTSLSAACYNNNNSITHSAKKQEKNDINLYYSTLCAILLNGWAWPGYYEGRVYKLSNELETIFSDKVLRRMLTQIEPKIRAFDELREAMRIAPQAGSQGLNSDGMDADMETIEGNVRRFRQQLADDPKRAAERDYQKMLHQIDKYWKKLFADPIQVDTPEGKVTIQPQRTNNIMERFFRDLKTAYRRKTGHDRMSKTFQAMLADTPLVKNLQNEAYMKILLNGKPTLEERFAEIDIAAVRKQLNDSQKSLEKIPATIKKIISKPRFPQIIANLFRANATRAALI
jgi:hypothetical protein